jgi:hypothetical protein
LSAICFLSFNFNELVAGGIFSAVCAGNREDLKEMLDPREQRLNRRQSEVAQMDGHSRAKRYRFAPPARYIAPTHRLESLKGTEVMRSCMRRIRRRNTESNGLRRRRRIAESTLSSAGKGNIHPWNSLW